jgi:hypothetical protein
MVCALLAAVLGAVIAFQLPPIPAFMNLSKNVGPSRSTLIDDRHQLHYSYAVSEDYALRMTVQKGSSYPAPAPLMAIWVENQSAYHIHTLYTSEGDNLAVQLPYWHDKRAMWRKAREEFEQKKEAEGIDGVARATPNNSFDPADYMLGTDQRYTVMMEINDPGDDGNQPSLIYSVEVSNASPVVYQTLTLLGIPEPSNDEEHSWQIGYDTSRLTTAQNLIDSVLLTLQRSSEAQP